MLKKIKGQQYSKYISDRFLSYFSLLKHFIFEDKILFYTSCFKLYNYYQRILSKQDVPEKNKQFNSKI